MKALRRLLLLIFLLAASAVAVFKGRQVLEQREQLAETKYLPVAVDRGDIRVHVLSTGTVQPENRLEIKPPVAGRIDEVLVDEGQVVRRGDLLATMSSTERAAMLDAARAQGAAELKRWQDFYRPTPIIAPLDGTLILRNIEAGQTVTATDAVLVMSDNLIVSAQVDETDMARIKPRQSATILLDAYADRPLAAHVQKIAYEARTVNNVTTYLVDVAPEESPDFMRSGMTANISFEVEERSGVLRVPAYAVVTREGQSFVLKPDSRQTGKHIEVEVGTGVSDGEYTEILSGLAEGEIILGPALGERKVTAASPFNFMGRRR